MHPVSGQNLGQGGDSFREGFPPHEGHGPAPGLVVGAGGHGREPGGVVIVEPNRAGCQGVQRRSPDVGVAVCAQVVPAEGVGDNPDHVHADLFSPSQAGCETSGDADRNRCGTGRMCSPVMWKAKILSITGGAPPRRLSGSPVPCTARRPGRDDRLRSVVPPTTRCALPSAASYLTSELNRALSESS